MVDVRGYNGHATEALLEKTRGNNRMSKTAAESTPGCNAAGAQELELAQLIVTALNLDVAAADIDPNTPLYNEGLGLDSIDILEIALVISKTYGVKVRSDDENNSKIFSSLRALNTHIQEHRTKSP